MEKHNSIDVNTLKLKEKLTISESHVPKTFEKSSPNPNKSNIKIKSFSTITRPADSFIDNLVEGKETLILPVTQVFTPQETIKHELELRNLPPVGLLRFDGNLIYWPEFAANLTQD